MADPVSTALADIGTHAGLQAWANKKHFRCWLFGLRQRNELVRISCAQLIRFEFQGKFLLVPSERIRGQMQPPGGVVKALPDGIVRLSELMYQPDSAFSQKPSDKNDLRIRLPRKNLTRFLKWYSSMKGRERTPAEREFREELLETKILDPDLFAHLSLGSRSAKITGPRFSEHFQCQEVLLHEFFQPSGLTPKQEDFLRTIQASRNCDDGVGPNAKFGWFSADAIARGGHFTDSKKQTWRIADHAKWML